MSLPTADFLLESWMAYPRSLLSVPSLVYSFSSVQVEWIQRWHSSFADLIGEKANPQTYLNPFSAWNTIPHHQTTAFIHSTQHSLTFFLPCIQRHTRTSRSWAVPNQHQCHLEANPRLQALHFAPQSGLLTHSTQYLHLRSPWTNQLLGVHARLM